MSIDPPFNVYRDQLTSLYHGLALWNPNPPKSIYDHASIGDVGYVHEGVFIRMFNVILPWDHESNRTPLGKPEPYESLDCGSFTNIVPLKTQEHYSRFVSAETNDNNAQAREPDDMEGVTYKCRGHGALLYLPHGGRRADIVIRTKVFEDYIRDHVVSWFTWAQKNQQGVERMEDLILVSGCTLVSSWAAAAFVYSRDTMDAKISLAKRTLSNGGECFIWGNIRGAVEYHDSNISPQYPPTTPDGPDQCVFIRGFRAKRVLFWAKTMRAAAEPLPDDPDNRRDDEIQVTRVPDGTKYRDPLIGVLDYIAEKCPKDATAEDTIAIAHDDDLQLIKDVETLTADAIEEFLHEKQMPLLVENGVAILRDSPGTGRVTTHEVAFSVNTTILGEQIKPPTYPFSPPSEGPSGPRKLDSSPPAMAYHHSWPSPIGSQNQPYARIPFFRSGGYLTRMFDGQDAAFFIESLLKVDVRNVYLVGNVPGCHNALMVQSPSNQDAHVDVFAPPNNQPLWILDMIPPPMYQVVPQKIWTPPNQSDRHRYDEQACIRMPVFFIQNDGTAGLPLVRALVGDRASLRGANMPAPLGGGHSTQIRIAWPGYDLWERQIQIRDQTRQRNEITLERFVKLVAGVVERFFTYASSIATPDGPWRVGHVGITRDNVIIVGAVQVSAGGWMPILLVYILQPIVP